MLRTSLTFALCLFPIVSGFNAATPFAMKGTSARNFRESAARPVRMVATPLRDVEKKPLPDYTNWKDLSQAPPFTLKDMQEAIPKHLWEKNAAKSMSYLFKDVVIIAALAVGAIALNNPFVWPLYWLAQGTMFWALFVVGHDCGHGSFSNNKSLNSLVGHITHSSIMVPYHGWRISHRTHHANHGNVDADESWYPTSKKGYEEMTQSTDVMGRLGTLIRFTLIGNLLAYPLYLWNRSPGRQSGSHYDWSFTKEKAGEGALFKNNESNMIKTSTACLVTMLGLLGAIGAKFGAGFVVNTWVMPYVFFVIWLDAVTYLHHTDRELPWYRGEDWSYLRGGLTTTDRDYGILNKVQHDIGTHVVHHLFPQIPHYNLCEATEAVKPLMGPYYREPKKSGLLPFHLIVEMIEYVKDCQYVDDEGTILYYKNKDGKVTSSEEGAKIRYPESERA